MYLIGQLRQPVMSTAHLLKALLWLWKSMLLSTGYANNHYVNEDNWIESAEPSVICCRLPTHIHSKCNKLWHDYIFLKFPLIWHWSIYWSRPLCICNFQFKHIIPQHYIAWIVLLEGIGCGSSAVLQEANTETITDNECSNYWNNIGQEHQCVYNGQTSACMVRTHVWSHLAMNMDGEGTTNLYGITGWLFWHMVFAFPLWLYLLGQREPLESVYRIIDVVPVKKQPGELPSIKMLRWGRGGGTFHCWKNASILLHNWQLGLNAGWQWWPPELSRWR